MNRFTCSSFKATKFITCKGLYLITFDMEGCMIAPECQYVIKLHQFYWLDKTSIGCVKVNIIK